MYNTRASQKAAMYADENKRVAVEAPKAAAAGKAAASTNSTATSRRALADVANLAGAMSKGLSVKSEAQERSFGTNLSNAGADSKRVAPNVPKATRTAVAAGRAPAPLPPTAALPPQPVAPAVMVPVVPAHSGVGSTTTNGQSRSRSTACRTTRVKKDQQSLTATLTSTAEEATGGLDLDMMDAEEPLPDIDSADLQDPLSVAEYVADIYQFYRRAEVDSVVPSDYMQSQADINDKMRGILLDWLVEVHLKFKLMPETLYLTTNLIDRFLAVTSVSRKNLQLVGVTAMLLASKYEEIWAPEVKDFVYISDNAYTKDQILAMEKLILNTLKFNLTVPTPYVFTARYLKAAQADKDLQVVTWFMVELCLPEYSMLRFTPSHIAASAVYTANRTLGRTPCWSHVLTRHTGLTEHQLRMCASQMITLHQKAGTGSLTAVHKKYSGPKFHAVSQLPPAILPADDGASQC